MEELPEIPDKEVEEEIIWRWIATQQ